MFENVEVGDKVAMFNSYADHPSIAGKVVRVEVRSFYTEDNDKFYRQRWCRKTGLAYDSRVDDPGSIRVKDNPKDVRAAVKKTMKAKRVKRLDLAAKYLLHNSDSLPGKALMVAVKGAEELVREVKDMQRAALQG